MSVKIKDLIMPERDNWETNLFSMKGLLPKDFYNHLKNFNSSPGNKLITIHMHYDDLLQYTSFKKYQLVYGSPDATLSFDNKGRYYYGGYPSINVYKVSPITWLAFTGTVNSYNEYIDKTLLIIERRSDDSRSTKELTSNVMNDIINDCLKFKKSYDESRKDSDAKNGLFLQEDLDNALFSDIQRFIDSYKIYKELGIKWKRGYIFHGPPGNGKTKTIRTISRLFGLKTIDINDKINPSGRVRFDDEYDDDSDEMDKFCISQRWLSFKDIITRELDPMPVIYYIEDIEKVVGTQTDRDLKSMSLTNILNVIDGVKELKDGSIFIATSNDIEPMAKSLVSRPGRFDKIFKFEPPDIKQIMDMFHYYGVSIVDGKQDVTEKTLKKAELLSMAYVEELIKLCVTKEMCKTIPHNIAEQSIREINNHKQESEKNFKIGFNNHEE